MAEAVLMPKLGLTMDSGLILGWMKREGEAVAKGEGLFEVESDKSNVAVEAQSSGTLIKIVHGSGETIECGKVIAYIGVPGEKPPATADDTKPHALDLPPSGRDGAESESATRSGRVIASPRARKAARERGVDLSLVGRGSGTNGRIEERDVLRFAEQELPGELSIKASPLARKLASLHGLDLSSVHGRGPGGRIVRDDVQEAAQTQRRPSPAEVLELPVSKIRSRIADRLSTSFFGAPHYYLKTSVDMEQLLACRDPQDRGAKSEKVPSIDALVAKVATPLLQRHPLINASWQGSRIILFQHVDIGFAVATDEGLITPVVRHCEDKSLAVIDEELRQLAGKAKEGRLLPADYQDNTFTITNLGMFDIESFTAIINPPASAILAVGKVIQKPVVRLGELAARPVAELVLGCDHRVIDGAVGAAFLRDLKKALERPLLLMLEMGKW